MKSSDETVRERIRRAKELLATARHAAMATVNVDGTPHNTPFFYMLNRNLKRIYFGSHPESLHTQNLLRTGQMFVVIYDVKISGGLYIRGINGHELKGEQRAEAAALYNAARIGEGKKPVPSKYYADNTPQRLYGTDIVNFWVNVSTRDKQGFIIREYRHEITAEDLLE